MVSNKVGNDSPPVLNSSRKEKKGGVLSLSLDRVLLYSPGCTGTWYVIQATLDTLLAFNAWGSTVPASWEYVLSGLLESLTVAGFCRSPGFLHRCHSRVIENRPRGLLA